MVTSSPNSKSKINKLENILNDLYIIRMLRLNYNVVGNKSSNFKINLWHSTNNRLINTYKKNLLQHKMYCEKTIIIIKLLELLLTLYSKFKIAWLLNYILNLNNKQNNITTKTLQATKTRHFTHSHNIIVSYFRHCMAFSRRVLWNR